MSENIYAENGRHFKDNSHESAVVQPRSTEVLELGAAATGLAVVVAERQQPLTPGEPKAIPEIPDNIIRGEE